MVTLKMNTSVLNEFQISILYILSEYIKYFIPCILSNKSYFSESENPFCIFYNKENFSLSFTIWRHEVHINSKYYDIKLQTLMP